MAGAFLVAASFASSRAQSTVLTVPPDTASAPPQDSAPASSTPAGHKTSAPSPNPAETTAALARLTEANQELLDLLKKQQAVLEDIQFDRRLQSRQISSLEERLEESLQENSQLQAKIAKLEEQISLGPQTDTKSGQASSSSSPPPAPQAIDASPPPPSTYLPAPESEGAPGTKSWHRLFTLSGTDGKKSDLFKIEGRQWRVLWHNLDQPGDVYKNTSALFISAFPEDDTIPQNVCSKLGTGGDSTELNGPGEFYLKIEGSGGSWELAVEDFK
jgi:hypothetical protein